MHIRKRILVTGGSGFLGQKHAEAIAEIGGIPVIIDIEKNNKLFPDSEFIIV